MMWTRLPVAALAAAVCLNSALAADWPQWRGANRDGKSADKGLAWPKDGPKLLWTNENVGAGYGQPAVVGDRIYICGASASKAGSPESLLCLSLKDGKEIWKTELGTTPGKFSDDWGGGTRSTPTVHGETIFILGANGDLVSCNKTNGEKRWSKNLVKDFGGKVPSWGYAESVLIDGENLICTPGSKTPMVALNATSGATVWKTEGDLGVAGYSSIMITEAGGVKQYVQQTMQKAFGVNAKDGTVLWSGGEIGRRTAVIPTPIVSGDFVFYTAGYKAGCELFKVGAGGKADLVYSKNKLIDNHHGGVIEHEGFLYGHSDNAGWFCFDFKKGGDEAIWTNKGPGKGSITYADGHFYCYGESKGELVKIKATKEDWKEVGKMTIPKTSKTRPGSGKVWPHPVIANGKLFLRDFDLLFVYDLTSGTAN